VASNALVSRHGWNGTRKYIVYSVARQVEAEAADDVSEHFEISVVPTFVFLRVS
jgi:hypothetical protein